MTLNKNADGPHQSVRHQAATFPDSSHLHAPSRLCTRSRSPRPRGGAVHSFPAARRLLQRIACPFRYIQKILFKKHNAWFSFVSNKKRASITQERSGNRAGQGVQSREATDRGSAEEVGTGRGALWEGPVVEGG